MPTTLFTSLNEEDKSTAIESLIKASTPRDHFFLMVILSVIMATFGLLIDNSSVIIGSMLIAPILSPLLSLSLGIVISDRQLIFRSFFTLVKSVAMGIVAAAIISVLFIPQVGFLNGLNGEIISRMEPSIIFAAIAIVAGLAASFAMVKPELNNTLPGIAISVALIPPLAVTGIGLARFDWSMMTSSFILFLINAAAIVFASMIIFSLMNLYRKRPVAKRVVQEEEAKVVEEKKEAQAAKEMAEA